MRTVPVSRAMFNQMVSVEEKSEPGYFLLKNDGSKVYGSKVRTQSGIAVKDFISIDDQKFKHSDIVGYSDGKFFYGRYGTSYAKRLVRGAINVYQHTEWIQTTSGNNGFGRSYARTSYYYQKGNSGELILFGNNDIKEIVRSCPKALAMADKSADELKKAVKANPSYLNEIFETYNKECSTS
jgi:hypothetical protein